MKHYKMIVCLAAGLPAGLKNKKHAFEEKKTQFQKKALFIFPSTYDGKIQWSTSGIENVADFCHFVT